MSSIISDKKIVAAFFIFKIKAVRIGSNMKNLFILLENCGHQPWIEKSAKVRYYNILKSEIEFIS